MDYSLWLTNVALAIVQPSRWSEWFWEPLRLNWPLVLVGTWAVWAALRTLGTIKRQADIMERQTKDTAIAAQAAKASADALMNSQRAWVMVDALFFDGSGIVQHTQGDGKVRTSATLKVILKNSGPTPAWIFEQFVRLEVIDKVIISEEVYPPPVFIGPGFITQTNYQILPITSAQEPFKWRADVQGDGWATDTNALHTYIYGIVRYRDAFSSYRETYFGYSVRSNGALERIPNEAYNKHT
jgi:hypothetical protein